MEVTYKQTFDEFEREFKGFKLGFHVETTDLRIATGTDPDGLRRVFVSCKAEDDSRHYAVLREGSSRSRRRRSGSHVEPWAFLIDEHGIDSLKQGGSAWSTVSSDSFRITTGVDHLEMPFAIVAAMGLHMLFRVPGAEGRTEAFNAPAFTPMVETMGFVKEAVRSPRAPKRELDSLVLHS